MPLIKYYEGIVFILGISQFPPPNYFIVFNPSNNHTSIEKSGLKTTSQSSKASQGCRSFVQCMNAVERVEFKKLPSHERKRQYNAAKRFCQSNENFSVHDGDSSVGTTVPETKESPELNLSTSKGLSSQTEQEKTDLLRLEREQWTNRNVGENWLFDAIVDCEAFVSYCYNVGDIYQG